MILTFKDNMPDILMNGVTDDNRDGENTYDIQSYLSSATKTNLIIQKVPDYTELSAF